MDKVIIGIIIISVLTFGGIYVYNNFIDDSGNSRVENDEAQKNKDKRYLTIINKTDKTINEVHVEVGEGTEIEEAYQENPDENSFSIEIPKEYNEYKKFAVRLVDSHDMYYIKTVDKVKETGRTEVTITGDDYTKRDGDWKRKLEEWFNND